MKKKEGYNLFERWVSPAADWVYNSIRPFYGIQQYRKKKREAGLRQLNKLESEVTEPENKYGLKVEDRIGLLAKLTEQKRRIGKDYLKYRIAETTAIIFLLIAASIFISNSNSPTGYAIFSSDILTLNLSPILGILSLIVALILLMNKKD